jgi:hypothetical protein
MQTRCRVFVGLACACVLVAAVPAANADVRAFRVATGSEDTAFVSVGPSTVPSLVVPDQSSGAYLFGRIRVGGADLKVAHVLANGKVDRSFDLSIDNGSVISAAARGGELALLGTFRSVDGAGRRHVAVVDAGSGRLLRWAPALAEKPVGQGFPHIVFTASRLVAGVDGAVVGWRAGVSAPAWTSRSSGRDVPEIAPWHGSILAAESGELMRIDPANGRARLVTGDFRSSELQTIGGRLYYSSRGTYVRYGEPQSVVPRCGQESALTAPSALAGTARTLFVAEAPVDADPPTAKTTIVACSPSGERTAGFHPPALRSVGAMAVVGTHLLVFTSGR